MKDGDDELSKKHVCVYVCMCVSVFVCLCDCLIVFVYFSLLNMETWTFDCQIRSALCMRGVQQPTGKRKRERESCNRESK